MNYQERAILASVIFAILVFLLIETFTNLHRRMQMVLVLHPQIGIIIIIQAIFASIALFIHFSNRGDKRRISNSLAFISLCLTLYVLWLCFHP